MPLQVEHGRPTLPPSPSPLVGSTVASAPPRWQVLSVDTHKTEGSFTFSVGGR